MIKRSGFQPQTVLLGKHPGEQSKKEFKHFAAMIYEGLFHSESGGTEPDERPEPTDSIGKTLAIRNDLVNSRIDLLVIEASQWCLGRRRIWEDSVPIS
jgi:hypothetical protein